MAQLRLLILQHRWTHGLLAGRPRVAELDSEAVEAEVTQLDLRTIA